MFRRILARLKVAEIAAWREREEIRRAAITFACGLVILLLMHIPTLEQTLLGDLDRNMLDLAFKLRSDVTVGHADPVVFLDLDDRTVAGDPSPARFTTPVPAATTPRALIAQLLDYVITAPQADAGRVVVLDADIGVPAPGDAGVEQLKDVLRRWAASPGAPPLIIAREAFPPAAVGASGEVKILPVSEFDPIINAAPNIFYASVKVNADQNGVVRDFTPFECVRTGAQVQPLFSAALLAYGFLAKGKLPPHSNAKSWVSQAPGWCARQPQVGFAHGERIDYHFSLEKVGFEQRVWPELPADWSSLKPCGDTDRSIFRRLSASDVIAGGADASHAPICGRIVLIGGTNTAQGDFRQSPLNEMSGSAILGNAIRGLQMTGGGLRPISTPVQILVLLLVCIGISLTFAASDRARKHMARMRAREKRSPLTRLQLIVLNPVVLNWSLALAAHLTGVGLLILSLNYGYWGYLSAPALGAAIMETIQEFADDD